MRRIITCQLTGEGFGRAVIFGCKARDKGTGLDFDAGLGTDFLDFGFNFCCEGLVFG